MSVPPPPQLLQVGRQPLIDYVTKDYAGFRQGMLDLIPSLLPNWSDRSENDFGVVLIEMFAYVADILSYYQDRAANEAFLRTATQRRSVIELLRLIGYQVDPGLSATTLLHVDVTADLDLLEEKLPYRVKTSGVPGQPDVVFEVTLAASLERINSAIDIPPEATLGPDAVSVVLPTNSHALVSGDNVYFEDGLSGPTARRSPLLRIVNIENAGTGQQRVSWLPALGSAFDPTKTKLKGNNVSATHGLTVTDEPIYVGDGTGSQSFKLSRGPVTFLLAPARTGSRYRSAPELEVSVDGVAWSLVDNFFASELGDTHFRTLIDENDALTVQFGTGGRGAVVPPGAQVKVTYRIGLGQSGNLGPDTLTTSVTSLPEVKSVSNPFAATGGADRESIEEAKIAGPGSVISQARAVTLQDFELLSKGFAGVGKARARVGLRGGYKVVQVFVVPEDKSGAAPPAMPSAELKQALAQFLTSRMPVNRMAGVDVLDPAYVPIDISIDVHVKSDASASRVKSDVRAALGGLLTFAQVDLGSALRVGDVFAVVYPIGGIAFVRLRGIARGDARGGSAQPTGDFADVALLESELPYPGSITVNTIGGGP